MSDHMGDVRAHDKSSAPYAGCEADGPFADSGIARKQTLRRDKCDKRAFKLDLSSWTRPHSDGYASSGSLS